MSTPPPQLTFSSRSLIDSSVTSDPSLGIHYKCITSRESLAHKRTTFTRWDPHLQETIVVAEWDRKWGKHKLTIGRRTGKEDEIFPQVKALKMELRFQGSFIADNGKTYTGRSEGMKSLTLYCSENPDVPVATFHRGFLVFEPRHPYIELGVGWENILDYIIVTCVIAQLQRVENQWEVALEIASTVTEIASAASGGS